jgi:hypothetical protein
MPGVLVLYLLVYVELDVVLKGTEEERKKSRRESLNV